MRRRYLRRTTKRVFERRYAVFRRLVLIALLLEAVSVYLPSVAFGQEMTQLLDQLKARIQSQTDRHAQGTVAVAVIDPETETRLEILGDRSFHAASTMKVPVLIELFRQAAGGRFRLEDSLVVENRFSSIVDGSPYRIEQDSDDALYARLGSRVAIRTLAERMITVSSNLAANLLIELVGADSVQQTVERIGAGTMSALRGVEDLKAFEQGLNNTATAWDLALLLDAIRRGDAVSRAASEEMVDMLLAEEYEDMIPAGLPETARAAHKTGWITGIEHDAAIVYPDCAPPYVLVILTEGYDDPAVATRLGSEITRAVHRALRP